MQMKRSLTSLAMAAMCVLTAISAGAATIDLPVIQDTYARIAEGSWTNHASDPYLKIRDASFGSDTKNWTRAFLKFDLSALPAGAIIDSAQMRLTIANCQDVPGAPTSGYVALQSIRAYRITEAWTEKAPTSVYYPKYDANAFTSIPSRSAKPAAGTVDEYNITSVLNGWVDGTYANHGVALKMFSLCYADIDYASRENISGFAPAVIRVNYSTPDCAVPELPASMLSLTGALLGVPAVVRRRFARSARSK